MLFSQNSIVVLVCFQKNYIKSGNDIDTKLSMPLEC